MPLELTAARPDPALLDLPWSVPLEDWPADRLAALPRGISRHTVRFVRLSHRVLAIKEIKVDLARREYAMLRNLERMDLPCVEPFGVVSGRQTPEGMPLDACLITRHLQYSLPYDIYALGQSFYNQAFVLDPAANALGFVASNAGHGVFGNM